MNFTSSLPPLPVDEVLPDLAAALRNGNRALLTAPPGSGKTTRVPSCLADAGPAAWGAGAVLVLEPRRLAARSAARYVARLRGGEAGGEIVCAGTPEHVAACAESVTGKYLKPLL